MAQATSEQSPVTVHASCVAIEGHAVLITGASGQGKSSLALQMLSLGAGLVADDRTILSHDSERLIATAPEPIKAQIEARFLGILAAPYAGPAIVRMVVTMDELETERLPHPRRTNILGVEVPLIRRADTPHFPASLCAYLKGDRIA